jgi:short-subunit dehydrogenase
MCLFAKEVFGLYRTGGSNPPVSAPKSGLNKMDKLFIITGASGKLGLSFINELAKQQQEVIGLTRSTRDIENVKTYQADLLIEKEVASVFDKILFSNYEEIYLIHAVGAFKFHRNASDILDNNRDGIDDEVYATNVLTLKNTLKSLHLHKGSAQIKVCAFASVSDKHNVPFWSSYTKSKNIMREYLKELCGLAHIQALIVNVSTVDTGNENNLRPNADKTYWLKPSEIVVKVLPELMSLSAYKEIDVIKEKPGFDSNYYLDHEAILKKWETEMGKE